MSDLLDRLQDMVDFKHDDKDVAREAIEEIIKLEAQHGEQAATIARLYAKREALQEEIFAKDARIAELERLLGLADSWISAAIECKEWRWDADQHEAAIHTRDEIRAALGGKDG